MGKMLVALDYHLSRPVVGIRGMSSWLITGCSSGFGLETAKWIARRGGKHVVLLSRRSAEGDDVQSVLAELRRIGAEPQAFSCDVADRGGLSEVMEHLHATLPPVRGIFHAAAVIDDVPLVNLTEERLRTVLTAIETSPGNSR